MSQLFEPETFAVPVFIALGSNVGNRLVWLQQGLEALMALPEFILDKASSVYDTAPVLLEGQPPQSPYLNAVVSGFVKNATPEAFLSQLLAIELACRRVREGASINQPRTLDLDLLAFGTLCQTSPTLTLPHPRLHQRGFVLAPWAQIQPQWQHPVLKQSVTHLLKALAPVEGVKLYAEPEAWLPPEALNTTQAKLSAVNA